MYEVGPILWLRFVLQRPVVAQPVLVCQYIASFIFPIGHDAEDANTLVAFLVLAPFAQHIASKNLVYFGGRPRFSLYVDVGVLADRGGVNFKESA